MEQGELTLVRDTSPMAAAPEARFTPGTVVAGRYRIVSLLGGGGMGCGTARITDFGLAGLAHESRSVGGTLLYMAPEQLDAGVATTRSDIYALGLVLYEMFRGRRVFDARTLQDLRAQHSMAKTRPASVVTEIDPAVERVILRCLEEEPQQRFATADEVLLALPGGDPLRAAVAAGETPSPEMVAAAARTGELSAPRAWAMLALTLLLLAVVPAVRLRNDVRGYLPEVKSPAVLHDRAATILRRLGYTPSPHTHGAYLRSTPKFGTRIGPDAAPYLYRSSPEPLVPLNENAVVRRNDPALIEPGMTSMLLDAEGNLLELRRVATGFSPSRDGLKPVTTLFEAAGLDVREFRSVPPQWIAMVPSDARAAWLRDRDRLRVEAASAAGRPVWFAVLKPGTVPYADERPRDPQAMAVMFLAVVIVGAFFARKNVVRGRADLRGAMRVALFNRRSRPAQRAGVSPCSRAWACSTRRCAWPPRPSATVSASR